MRITTGQFKGRKLLRPEGIRPTQDKVRKALFDILGDIEGLTFLELFAGSGAIGIEAISRGAKEVVFVENNPYVLKALTTNTSYLLSTKYHVLPLDAEKAMLALAHKERKFDIIFLDPPYQQGFVKKSLQTLEACDILSPDGLIIVQHFKKDNLPDNTGVLSLLRQYKYGTTLLSVFREEVLK